MNKKYIVRLTAAQRATLEQRTRTGTVAASVQRHARILLKADTAADGPAWDDAAIAAALDVSVPTVERVRQRFVQVGLDGSSDSQISFTTVDGSLSAVGQISVPSGVAGLAAA